MSSRAGRIALAGVGLVCVGLGAIGIFVPVLPTTPFLLLAAWCFIRSSRRLHAWLLGHRRLGPYVAGFLDGGGMPRRAKRTTLVTLWSFIALSAVIVWVRSSSTAVAAATAVVLVVVAALVTRFVVRLPTRGPRLPSSEAIQP